MAVCNVHRKAYVTICSECVIEAYRDGVRSRNRDMFKYSGYWRSWSRILAPMDNRFKVGQIEVDLTAVNPDSEREWPRVRRINIRAHRTEPYQGDILSHSLPVYAFDMMKKWMPDQTLLNQLLHEDLLPLIDWTKYSRASNGGAALADILKGW